MKFRTPLLAIFFSIPIFVVCAQKNLSSYNFNSNEQYDLDAALNEVSGLSFNGDKVYAHNDESATIFQLDPKSGKIIKKFTVGNPAIADDFEGLAIANNKFYLINSRGEIFMFSEAKDRGNAGYKKFSTGITNEDIEGLCFDEATNSLLIACKGIDAKGKKSKKGHQDTKVIYSFDLNKKKVGSNPRFTINLEELNSKYGLKSFSPSGIEKNIKTGSFFILSSKDKSIVEITKDGKILNAVKLDEYRHNQPEGIAFAPDGSLVITDEGGKGRATLTKYGFR